MKCSVFIAASTDGYIAEENGGLDWLHTSGNPDADMSENFDMGFADYINSVDCMVIGRKSMETLSSFNLTPEQWPYGDIKIYVLSSTLTQAPENVSDKVEVFSGDISSLARQLEKEGYKHAYIDGGLTITSFLNERLINEITITRVPVILGRGIPLFGKVQKAVQLREATAIVFPNDYIQTKYTVNYL
ncbi:dihydrofolate reductase family protein [Vibrio sp. YMD68]|uniref:dihydrofolate reductase family protein n=1 Tax=Vibrio sp. YMD68 TaxID=3042300 RepID=UPI00249C5F72|nr:dihydrofolate reductase family protein [Vibrio sp. YMD68]WGV99231.1 dihydrofolate reductase family protein [Vibrio sp. YMD68]